jgi:hypothetical protein
VLPQAPFPTIHPPEDLMIPSLRKVGLAVAGAVVVAAAGCGEAGDPVSSFDGAAPAFSAGGGPDVSHLARFQSRRQITIAWAKMWIGPAGGRLDFQGFAIDVPAGAVDRVTMFSIRLPVDPKGSERVVAEFGPHGATFARPVAIELPYAGTSMEGARSPTVVWWNDAWVNMGGSLTADGKRLRTLTDHFSTYGATDERSGSMVVSGG